MVVSMNDETEEKRSGSHGLVILVVVVVLAMLGAVGAYVYHVKQQEALASCRQSVAEFSAARKAILDTSDNSSELQKVLRDVLGVDDVLDAFADARPAPKAPSTWKDAKPTPPSRNSISSPKH